MGLSPGRPPEARQSASQWLDGLEATAHSLALTKLDGAPSRRTLERTLKLDTRPRWNVKGKGRGKPQLWYADTADEALRAAAWLLARLGGRSEGLEVWPAGKKRPQKPAEPPKPMDPDEHGHVYGAETPLVIQEEERGFCAINNRPTTRRDGPALFSSVGPDWHMLPYYPEPSDLDDWLLTLTWPQRWEVTRARCAHRLTWFELLTAAGLPLPPREPPEPWFPFGHTQPTIPDLGGPDF